MNVKESNEENNESKISLNNEKELKEEKTKHRKKARILDVKEIEKEISNEREDLKKAQKERKKDKRFKNIKKFFIFCFVLGTICCYVGLFLLYGPSAKFRDWLVTSAMTTMRHKYFATWFYDDETIDAVLANNNIIETGEITNTSLYTFTQTNLDSSEKVTYKNEYERQILDNPDGEDYKIIEISEKNFDGYLAVIYDPSRVHTVTTQYLGTRGEYLVNMAQRVNALIAINGGGFVDPNYNSNGATPLGVTITRGKIMTSASYNGSGGIIGFTENNELILTKCSSSQAQALGIRDCVTFGPFLIVNGVSSEVLGNGGWGQAPRTVIGQRADGIVLFLVVDGRTVTKPGADMNDLIEIMERYEVINAANLDGGTSSVMVVNGKIINDPIDSTGAHKTRWISTGFYLAPTE
jgi:exopolysaccharide biosynthesis protein